MNRQNLIRTELRQAIASANGHAKPDYQPTTIADDLTLELKQKMTRPELARYGLTGTIPEGLGDR